MSATYTVIDAPGSFSVPEETVNTEFLLFRKPSVSLSPEQEAALEAAALEAAPDVAILAPRVLPYGPDWHFDPVTLEAGVMTAECLLIRRSALDAAGGFDPGLSGSAAAADLCWRLRAAGYRLLYYPRITAEDAAPETEPTLAQYVCETVEACILRTKYGRAGLGLRELYRTLRQPKHFPGVRQALVKALPRGLLRTARATLLPAPQAALALADLLTPGWCPQRGRCALTEEMRRAIQTNRPLVSVIVRTCGRPDTLRETLRCLYHQTYKNFEVVIVEDGPATAEGMIAAEFADLPIRYQSTGKNVGRGRAGNIGIEAARGEYAVFLDDDDFYYPDLIELALGFLLTSGAELTLFGTMALLADVTSRSPYRTVLHRVEPVLFDHITRMDMCVKCRIPISGAMFRRSLYDVCGGMREDIDGDEDWAMWLRYLGRARRPQARTPDIPRALCACLYPADPAAAAARHAAYAVYDEQMLSDPSLTFLCTPEELALWRETVAADIAHLTAVGGLEPLRAEAAAHESADPGAPDGNCTLTAQQINRYYWHLVRQHLA